MAQRGRHWREYRYLWALAAMTAACEDGSGDRAFSRQFVAFRPLHDERKISVQGVFGGGSFRIVPGQPGELYRMDAAYDAAKVTPVARYNAARNTLAVGVEDRKSDRGAHIYVSDSSSSFSIEIGGAHAESKATLFLSPKVDAALEFMIGATDAKFELGGLRITSLALNLAASSTTVRFAQPNVISCTHLQVNGGAAAISLIGLANSRCQTIDFDGNTGTVLLDFSGSWTEKATANVNVAVGAVTLRLPRDVGVRITTEKVLTNFEPNGLIQKNGAFVSPDYEQAKQHLDIHLSTKIGSVKIAWAGDGNDDDT